MVWTAAYRLADKQTFFICHRKSSDRAGFLKMINENLKAEQSGFGCQLAIDINPQESADFIEFFRPINQPSGPRPFRQSAELLNKIEVDNLLPCTTDRQDEQIAEQDREHVKIFFKLHTFFFAEVLGRLEQPEPVLPGRHELDHFEQNSTFLSIDRKIERSRLPDPPAGNPGEQRIIRSGPRIMRRQVLFNFRHRERSEI